MSKAEWVFVLLVCAAWNFAALMVNGVDSVLSWGNLIVGLGTTFMAGVTAGADG